MQDLLNLAASTAEPPPVKQPAKSIFAQVDPDDSAGTAKNFRQQTIERSFALGSQLSSFGVAVEIRCPDAQEILKTFIPTRSYIPAGAASNVARCFTFAIEDLLAKNDVHSWTQFLALPKCLLNPIGLQGDKPVSFAHLINQRCSTFLAGNFHKIWHEVTQNLQTNFRKKFKNDWISLTKLKVEAGNLSSAFRSLESNASIKTGEDVIEKLKALHPAVEEFCGDKSYFAPDAKKEIFIPFDLDKSVQSFPRGTAAGPEGLQAQHLLDLLRLNPSGSPNDPRSMIGKLINHIINGRAPTAIAPLFAGARLIPLSKNDDGIRPIAIGCIWRRLTAKILFRHVVESASKYLEPNQFGVGVPSGAEKIIHTIRFARLLNLENPDFAILQLDFMNAFNKVSRKSFLDLVQKHFPELLPFVSFCYCFSPGLFVNDDTIIDSKNGSQQGDPLGPFLFCLVIDQLIKEISKKYGTKVLNLWYLDDGTIAGSVEIYKFFADEGPKLGLFLNPKKSKIYWPSESMENQELFPEDLCREKDGIVLLGAPIGNEEFVAKFFHSKMTKLTSTVNKLGKLEDSQIAFTLLQNCLGLASVNYLMRSTPLAETKQLCLDFDHIMMEALALILGFPLTPQQRSQVHLPLKLGGLGIKSASKHAVGAFVSSFNLNSKFLLKTFGQDANAEFQELYNSFLMSFETTIFTTLGKDNQHLPKSKSQKVISEVIDNKSLSTLLSKSSKDAKARILSCAGSHGAYIFKAPLSKNRGFRLTNPDFCNFVSLLLGSTNVCAKNETCRHCTKLMNDGGTGYHCQICKTGNFGPVARHNEQRDILHNFAQKAIYYPRKEVPINTNTKKTPGDLYFSVGIRGKPVAYDITVVHPLSDRVLDGSCATAGYAAKEAERRKNVKYADFCAQHNVKFIPVAVEAFGHFSESYE